jgi:hypothetical protein
MNRGTQVVNPLPKAPTAAPQAGGVAEPGQFQWQFSAPKHPGMLFGLINPSVPLAPEGRMNDQRHPGAIAVAASNDVPKGNTLNDQPPGDLLHEVPDFLAGFDKVAARMKSEDPSSEDAKSSLLHRLEEGTNQFSPTFTSRSFDDFHRFLGKGLDPLDSPGRLGGNRQGTSLDSAASGVVGQAHDWNLATVASTSSDTGLFSAEAYAKFAAESAAMVASQHAAYLSSPSWIGPSSEPFDIEGTVDIVSHHVAALKPEFLAAHSSVDGGVVADNHKETSEQQHKRVSVDEVPLRLTTMSQFYGRGALVSGSEPSNSATETESSSAVGSSRYNTGSGSDNTSSNGSEENGSEESNDDRNSDGSGSDGEQPNKKRKLYQGKRSSKDESVHFTSQSHEGWTLG